MVIWYPYNLPEKLPSTMFLDDHLYGFDQHGKNLLLDQIDKYAAEHGERILIEYHQILEPTVTKQYPNLDFAFKMTRHIRDNQWFRFENYKCHPEIVYKNFICSFNGSPHVGRQLLVSILKKFNYFNPEYCSKNFTFDASTIDGYLNEYLNESEHRLYNKFFFNNEDFNQNIYSFGHVRYQHDKNIYNLETKLTESFIHVASETIATSYVPFVTEKFMYSVVTRGLFLAYAQPGWHDHLEKYYGFKKYNKIFDYSFDQIQNPIHRLVALITMISKFDVLSIDDWIDLYHMELDTIEYNYNHYFSRKYLECFTHE